MVPLAKQSEPSAPKATTSPSSSRRGAKGYLDVVLDNAVWVLLVLLIVILSLLNPQFLSWSVLRAIASQSAVLGVVALAVAFTLLVGEIDLSVSAVLGITAFVGAWLIINAGIAFGFALIAMVVLGIILGAVNGFLVAKVKMNSLIETLAVLLTLQGALLFFAQGRTAIGFPDAFLWVGQGRIGGIPVLPVLVLLIYLAAAFLLRRTTYGRRLYAVGGNAKAARASGIRVDWVILSAFAISGGLAGLAGFLLASRTGAVTSVFGSGYLLYSVAAPIIGGVSLYGGRGNILGVLGGVLLLSVIDTGLQLAHISSYQITMVGGLLILLAVALDAFQVRIRKGSQSAEP